jgi:PncC family amidohydrolase
MEELIQLLTSKNKTISTMESCTGGALVNAITNIPGSSSILKFSAVTYSNDFKIKMGVSEEVIKAYTVYSMETAIEMAKNISMFTDSNYGIGITGRINKEDLSNLGGEINKIYVCIYDRDSNILNKLYIDALDGSRAVNKNNIVDNITKALLEIIK